MPSSNIFLVKCTDCVHIKGILSTGIGACWANPNHRRRVVIIRNVHQLRDCQLFSQQEVTNALR